MSCGVGRRCGLDLGLLWLWCRPAAAAPTRPLAWEPPYVAGSALKEKKKKKSRKKICDLEESPHPTMLADILILDLEPEEL